MFHNETFDQAAVLKNHGQHINIVQDLYRVHLERIPRYDCPPMIPTREKKSLVEDGNERPLLKEVNLPPGIGRYEILSTM